MKKTRAKWIKVLFVNLILISLQFQVESSFLFPNCQTENCHLFATNRAKKQAERGEMLKSMRLSYMRDEFEWMMDLSFADLQQRLQNHNLTAVEVLSSAIGRSVRVTEKFNCVTEYVPDAMKWAEELDSQNTIKGPLHGIPFCVKDDHQILGMDTTLGYSRNLYKPANDTATLVKILKDLGAIPFCKTNVPQTLMSFGSDNPIFGETLNPLNGKLSPGGSSSGTGCLVGGGAIKFGTGTDMVGSGRIPAHFNGISSLMPTSRRLSSEGITLALPHIVGLTGVPALFTDKPSTLVSIFKALTEDNRQYNYDPLTVPLPFNTALFEDKKPLRFGYITSLPFFPSIGDTPQTLTKVKDSMESLGHVGVPFDWPDAYKYMKIQGDLIFADGGKFFMNMIRDDSIAKSFRTFNLGIQFPLWQRRILGLSPVSPRLQLTLRAGLDSGNSEQLQDVVAAGKQIARDILNQMHEKNLDLIISPVFPTPAVRVDDPANLFLAVAYVALANLIDFPAGVISGCGVESGKRIREAYTDVPSDIFLSLAKTGLKAAVGMPIGIQIIGKPYQEEVILRAMNELQGLCTIKSEFRNF